jgi:hypothetical protein
MADNMRGKSFVGILSKIAAGFFVRFATSTA